MRYQTEFHSDSSKRLLSYDNLTVFKMAAVRHLRFLKIRNFYGRQGKDGQNA